MARPEVQTVHRGLTKEACAEPRRQKNRDVFVYVYRTHSNSRLHYSSVSFCSFKQIQSWVERPCWCYLWWCDLALTSVDIMLRWKMSCQLMEELPQGVWRQCPCVLTSFLVTFLSFSPPPLSLNFHLFLFPFPCSPQTPLPLPTLLCDKLLLAVDLLVVKSAPCVGMKVGLSRRRACVFPPPVPACRHHQSLVLPNLTHVRRSLTTAQC